MCNIVWIFFDITFPPTFIGVNLIQSLLIAGAITIGRYIIKIFRMRLVILTNIFYLNIVPIIS